MAEVVDMKFGFAFQHRSFSYRRRRWRMGSMHPSSLLLLSFTCDAPFIAHLKIEQMRRRLPRTKRRVALLYGNNSIELIS